MRTAPLLISDRAGLLVATRCRGVRSGHALPRLRRSLSPSKWNQAFHISRSEGRGLGATQWMRLALSASPAKAFLSPLSA